MGASSRLLVALSVIGGFMVAASQIPAYAASTVGVRGTVACPSGKPVVGVWVASSGGGSGYASWSAYPGASTIARFSRTFSTNLPTTIYLNVGCGGTPLKLELVEPHP